MLNASAIEKLGKLLLLNCVSLSIMISSAFYRELVGRYSLITEVIMGT